MKLSRFVTLSSLSLLVGLGIQACGDDGNDAKSGTSGTSDSGSSSATATTSSGTSSTAGSTSEGSTSIDVTTGSDSSSGATSDGGGGPVCETASSDAEIPPVYLAFAFDVSGSMGKLDEPRWWHDPVAKWIPVVEATSAFFEDPSSSGIAASLSLFPAGDDRCDSESYLDPEVSMTQLPSAAFATAFSDYEAEVGGTLAGGDWRGGTPTFAALSGAGQSLESLQATEPTAKFAIVLVTDGLPQDCDEGLEEAKEMAAGYFDDGLPTYVIGIENPMTPPSEPPDGWNDWGDCDEGSGGDDTPCTAPNTLDALNELAVSGGTQSAFLIDTGDPTATVAALKSAIEAIRESSLSCSLPIPEHPQGATTFEKDNIDVSVTIAGVTERFAYDVECSELGSWHYDDEETPTSIELCEATCIDLKSKPDAELNVDFLCEPREPVIR